MSVIAIIVIAVVVVALVLLALLMLRRFGHQAMVKKRELKLRQRRRRIIGEHHAEAERRERKADLAELRARIAEQEARRDRAEARVRQEKAAQHERGMADHELVEEHERERFAGPARLDDFRAGRRDEMG